MHQHLSLPKILSTWDWQCEGIGASSTVMLALLDLLSALIFDRFKSRRRLEVENLYLRHQLNIAMRKRRIGSDCAEPIEHSWSGLPGSGHTCSTYRA